MLPGMGERLCKEIQTLAPPGITVQVTAGTNIFLSSRFFLASINLLLYPRSPKEYFPLDRRFDFRIIEHFLQDVDIQT